MTKTPKSQKFPNRIKEHRERLGWSQEKLGSEVGTTYQQISRLERGERGLDGKWLSSLSRAMGVSQADLLVESIPIPGGDPRQGNPAKRRTEIRLLKFWRSLDPEDQDIILTTIDIWARRFGKDFDKD